MDTGKGALLILAALFLVGVGVSATTSPSVSIGDDGVQINAGGLDVGGNDINDSSTTVWDSSNGYVPSSQIQDSFVKNSGDTMTGSLDMKDNDLLRAGQIKDRGGVDLTSDSDGSSGGPYTASLDFDTGDFSVPTHLVVKGPNTGTLFSVDEDLASQEATLNSQGSLRVDAGDDGDEDCRIENTGDIECTGSKNWIHSLNGSYEAVYTSQESPQVRAVYEGKAHVNGPTNISLPKHFEKTVSDNEPKLRATATTQGKLAYASIMEKTDSYVVIDSNEEVDVNYRITGIREGYEDKQVVREKTE